MADELCTCANENMGTSLKMVFVSELSSVLIKKTLVSFCSHTENSIMSLHITSCVTVPVYRLCNPSGDRV